MGEVTRRPGVKRPVVRTAPNQITPSSQRDGARQALPADVGAGLRCAWCLLSAPRIERLAVAQYKGDSLCEPHLIQKREEVKTEWKSYLQKKERSTAAPW